jgi:hypothetical protein
MPSSRSMSRSRTYPIAVEDAFARTLATPLEELFNQRYLALPPIVRVEQDGEWTTAGQVRTIHTGDGGVMREELTSVEAPREFTYDLRPQGGPMKPLVARVEGVWRFAPVGTGCRIEWAWTVHPVSAAGGVALPAFARMWKGYAGRALDRLEDLLLAG